MQILSLKCNCDQLCRATVDKNAQCSLAPICRRNILEYIPHKVLHLATHTFHVHTHAHRSDCIYAEFINNARYLLGLGPTGSGKPSHTLCVHARPQSRANLTIHQRPPFYSHSPPFPSSHTAITTEALDLCQKCINNFHSNVLAVKIQASITMLCVMTS